MPQIIIRFILTKVPIESWDRSSITARNSSINKPSKKKDLILSTLTTAINKWASKISSMKKVTKISQEFSWVSQDHNKAAERTKQIRAGQIMPKVKKWLRMTKRKYWGTSHSVRSRNSRNRVKWMGQKRMNRHKNTKLHLRRGRSAWGHHHRSEKGRVDLWYKTDRFR